MPKFENRLLIRICLVGALAGVIGGLAHYYIEKGAKKVTKT